MNIQLHELAGRWLANKTRRQLREQGAFQAARNLRKQGCPLAVALLLLVGRV